MCFFTEVIVQMRTIINRCQIPFLKHFAPQRTQKMIKIYLNYKSDLPQLQGVLKGRCNRQKPAAQSVLGLWGHFIALVFFDISL